MREYKETLICDRCKKEINPKIIKEIILQFKVNRPSKIFGEYSIDLCEECWVEYENFMNLR